MTFLPSSSDLKRSLPLSPQEALMIHHHRKEIEHILLSKQQRLAFIIGPCSLHHRDSAIEYAQRVSLLQKKVGKSCLLIMRAHVEKPRTLLGWKGILYDPYLDGSHRLADGLSLARRTLLQIAQLGVPMATEFLDPIAAPYFSDLVSWGFIGARTSASQTHRQLASSLPMPVGFKNSTDGNLQNAVQGAYTATHSHHFLGVSEEGKVAEVQSLGNPHTHIVLRGSLQSPNYDSCSLRLAQDLLDQTDLPCKRILIDCSHGNSQKDPMQQANVLKTVLSQYVNGNERIMGMMLESHIHAGAQSFNASSLSPFISLTDPCIDWSLTEELILASEEVLSSLLLVSS